jgi:hypothetical protein
MLNRRNISDGVQETMVVEPPDPFEGGELNVFETAPGV